MDVPRKTDPSASTRRAGVFGDKGRLRKTGETTGAKKREELVYRYGLIPLS
jgi:hypothetical protein